MNKAVLITSSLLALTFSAVSSASLITGWGVKTGTSTASNCPSYCTTQGGGQFEYNSQGSEYLTQAFASENSYGTTQALADFSGAGYLPTLKVLASSQQGKGASASAFASQHFNFSGSSSEVIDLNFNLHGSVTGNNSSLRADVAVFIGDSLDWYPSMATLYYEVAMGFEKYIDSAFISTGVDVNQQGSLSFDIDVGQSFYVVASMQASARGGTADAWNTLSMNFTDDKNLTAITAQNTATIPEPPMFLFALMSAFALIRMRKNNRP